MKRQKRGGNRIRFTGRKGRLSVYYSGIKRGKIKIKPLPLSREEMLGMKDKIMRELEKTGVQNA